MFTGASQAWKAAQWICIREKPLLTVPLLINIQTHWLFLSHRRSYDSDARSQAHVRTVAARRVFLHKHTHIQVFIDSVNQTPWLCLQKNTPCPSVFLAFLRFITKFQTHEGMKITKAMLIKTHVWTIKGVGQPKMRIMSLFTSFHSNQPL